MVECHGVAQRLLMLTCLSVEPVLRGSESLRDPGASLAVAELAGPLDGPAPLVIRPPELGVALLEEDPETGRG